MKDYLVFGGLAAAGLLCTLWLFFGMRQTRRQQHKKRAVMLKDALSDEITDEARVEAEQNPGGWVYKIVGNYGPDDAVPPEAIAGAWKVDDNGEITGEFIPNPNFKQPK